MARAKRGRAAGRPRAAAASTRPAREDVADEAPEPAPPRWVVHAVLALVAAAALMLHGSALRAPFFADDFLFLDLVRHRSLAEALAAPDPIGNFLRPFGRAVHFFWLARLGNESPVPFHAMNLGLLLLSLALLFDLARRLAGVRAASFAIAVLAVHHAVDVPVRWASGSQDLLALCGALGALVLHARGFRHAAAAALLAGLLAKETVAPTAFVAVLVTRGDGESWRLAVRRAWPLFAATGVWGVGWLAARSSGLVSGAGLAFDPSGVAAAFVNLLRTVVGAEWRTGGGAATWRDGLDTLALVAAAAATWLAWGAGPPAATETRRGVLAGLGWALLGAVPVLVVAPIWSGYFYLFAMAGAALAAGAALSRTRLPVAITACAALLLGSQHARSLDEFATAPGVWTAQSHVNRHYLDRAMEESRRYLADLKAARPTLPPRSTLFFYGIPAFVGFQAADGPLVRWAYRDSSLRSYYTAQLTRERAARGPWFLFTAEQGRLREVEATPGFMVDLAVGQLLSERPAVAREVTGMLSELGEPDDLARYLDGWIALALRDTATFVTRMRSLRLELRPDRPPGIEQAFAQLERGDTAAATAIVREGVTSHVLDPGSHALLSDLLRSRDPRLSVAAIEAYAALQLAPAHAMSWLRWGQLQAVHGRNFEAIASLDRYRALGGGGAEFDRREADLRREVEAQLPGRAAVQKSLRARTPGEVSSP